jgi:hypothetical protein
MAEIRPDLMEETEYIQRHNPDYAYQDYLNRKLALNFDTFNEKEFDFILDQITDPMSNKYNDPLPHYVIERLNMTDEYINRVMKLLRSDAYKGLLLQMQYTNLRGETIFAVLMRALLRQPFIANRYKDIIIQTFPEVQGVEIEIDGDIHILEH